MAETEQHYPAGELLRAAQLEVAAELRGDGGNNPKASLREGRRTPGTGEGHEYTFQCKRWPEVLTGKPLLIRASRSRGGWTQADVTRLTENTLRVTTEADLGSHNIQAQLREDQAATWRVLAERLATVGEENHPVRLESAGWMIGRGAPKVARDTNPGRWVADWASLKLNPRQRQAVEQALASEVMFLWGPPGTGKTDVVAHIVEGCCRQGLTVLFLAPTKVAVDQALERICDLLARDSGFDAGLVQRAGTIDVESLRDRYGDYVDPERIAARLSAQLQNLLTEKNAVLATARAGIALYDRLRGLEEDLATARGDYEKAGKAVRKATQEHGEAQSAAGQLALRLQSMNPPTGWRAEQKQIKLDNALAEFRAAERRASDAETVQKAATATRAEAQATIARITSEITRRATGLVGLPSRADLVKQAEALRKDIEEAEAELRRVTDAVRANCRVLGTTVAKAVQSRSLLKRVDVVVIDEAAMVDLPSAWYVSGLAGKRVVAAGDFRQLPAITKAVDDRATVQDDRAHARRWAATDPFRAAGLVDGAGTVLQDPRLVALDTQYRMRAPICDLVNAVAYPDAPLRTGRDDVSRIPFNTLVDAHVLLIDTSQHRVRGASHKSNPVHAAAIRELVRGLQYDGVLPGRKWQDVPQGERATDRLAVITPYRDQVTALRQTLTERFGTDHEGLVATVHRFQGSQRPLVVLDTVAGASDLLGRFYEGTGLDSQTCRLLNVALSRAQDHLVVIADVEFLRRKLSPHSEARVMLDHVEAHAQTLSVDQLIPIRSAADLARLPAEELTRPAFFPADQVDHAVRWDIERARTRIDIYTFLLTQARVRRWESLFAERVAAGVEVVIHTRSPEEQQEGKAEERQRALVEHLRSLGCTVVFRERMHEKVFIVDGTVLWHGSLNLLAGMGPTDLMMRLEDAESCAQAQKVMDQARMERPVYRGTQGGAGRGGGRKNPAKEEGARVGAVVWGRLYLNVPYERRNEAKQEVNADWDGDNKLWYIKDGSVPREDIQHWLRPKR
ncbi:AAA domain-containing protein [Streptomyces sp. NPDC004539]|uniref:AAA domain-containing protein n=1 Tax=Streptomyces sp. NPDC004539 TaxID=3154280 RepID=UPI0033A04133